MNRIPVPFGEPSMRINLIGASGSGTSTLGRTIARALSIPHFESDEFYHLPTDPPFQQQRTPQDRFDLITQQLSPKASWVLSGGVVDWEPYPELNFTCIIFLQVPAVERIRRLKDREFQRFGNRVRPGGDMYQSHEEFIQWASGYDGGEVSGKTLARHEAYLTKQTCRLVRFDGIVDLEHIQGTLASGDYSLICHAPILDDRTGFDRQFDEERGSNTWL